MPLSAKPTKALRVAEHSAHRHHVDDTGAVAKSERRSFLTMGLLWTTMVTSFPAVLAGFQWHAEGITLFQSVSCAFISCLILLSYSVPACILGAVTGQSCALLARNCFGRWGSRAVSLNLIFCLTSWYGLTSLLLADALRGMLPLNVPIEILAATIAIVMSFNNLFGFAGIANFARFLAAPALILWVFFAFAKAACGLHHDVIAAAPTHGFSFALTTISSFVIGYAAWGNEPDFWRYAKPQAWKCALALFLALAVGQIIFPVTGWMIAHISGITDYGKATGFMLNYTFGGHAVLAASVLSISYFAINDSNLFGASNALQNLRQMPNRLCVTLISLFGAAMAVVLAMTGTAKSLEAVASLSCILLPTPTAIMAAECFLLSSMLGQGFTMTGRALSEVPAIKWPAITALIVGYTVGIASAGVIPSLAVLHVGISPLQAWLAALATYVVLRLIEHRTTTSS